MYQLAGEIFIKEASQIDDWKFTYSRKFWKEKTMNTKRTRC